MRRGPRPPRISEALIAQIRERYDISAVAARLGFTFRPSGHEFVGLCPWHGERTPSWTLNDAKGFAHCFGCGHHADTIGLVRDRLGFPAGRAGFVQALEWLQQAELPAVDPVVRQAQERANTERKLRQIQDARCWFADAPDVRPGDPVDVYLRARAITSKPPPTIRFGMVPAWQDRETGEFGPPRPCMLCAAQDVAGTITGVQRVFFQNNDPALGKADKPKRSWGIVKGSPLRLGPPAAHINVAEGPEDALSVREMMPERTVWAAFGTGLMPFLGLPDEVREVTLLGQNNAAGKAAVIKAGEALRARSLEVRASFPPEPFEDWNDLRVGCVQ